MTEQGKHYDVVAAVVEVSGKVLCVQHGVTRYAYTSNRWEFPGGKIEAGETPQQALHRELLEEMDYDVRVGKLLARVTHHYPDFSITLAAYHCTADGTDLTLREHIAACWLPWRELTSLDWCAADQRLVQQMMASIFK